LLTYYNRETAKRGTEMDVMDDVMYKIHKRARDNARTPMQVGLALNSWNRES